MVLRASLIFALMVGLAGCAGTPHAPFPKLLPFEQLVPPKPKRRPDPGLLARGAAVALRGAALAAP